MIEYKILMAESLVNETDLNEIAEDGWKLVAIVPVGIMYYFYFVKGADEF